ncbi:MAG: macro domain-containing protein [Mucilaginibacter sp.]|uniref:macro domain-containing protein n=1 Tax=Mucilaginibacter sp. TaxID=1882438 RepID=UPI00356869F5
MDSERYALVNTVNTVGVMGKGVALQFKNEFPHNYSIYRNACLARTFKIGEILLVKDTSLLMGERLIINFPTKTHWRLPSEYRFVEQGLEVLAETIATHQIATLAIPALGCGNGGLNWKVVKHLIIEALTPSDALLEIYEPFQ